MTTPAETNAHQATEIVEHLDANTNATGAVVEHSDVEPGATELVADAPELVTLDVTAYRDAIIQIDYLYEELQSIGQRWEHLESCSDEGCEDCAQSRREYRLMVGQMHTQLHNLVNLLTHRRIREIAESEFAGTPQVLERAAPVDKRLPGPKRFDLGRLNSDRALLDSLWRFGNDWRRLCDFTIKECRELADRCESAEHAARTVKDAFRGMEQRMNADRSSCVEDSFTEEELHAMFAPALPSLGSLRR